VDVLLILRQAVVLLKHLINIELLHVFGFDFSNIIDNIAGFAASGIHCLNAEDFMRGALRCTAHLI